jgi:surface protein
METEEDTPDTPNIMAGFTARQTENMEMLIGLGCPEKWAEKCAAADADDYKVVATNEVSCTGSMKTKEGANMDELRKIVKAVEAKQVASKGVIYAKYSLWDGVLAWEIVYNSADALDIAKGNIWQHYLNMIPYMDMDTAQMRILCCAEEMEFYRERFSMYGAKMDVRPTIEAQVLLERKILTDKDIHGAVKQWHEDPAAAERRRGHISDWDVSRVTDMSRLFRVGSAINPHFNEDLSKWQTGSVRDMRGMFSGASSFDSDLSQWQTGNVTDMNEMFYEASSFTSDLSKWQTDKVTDMSEMFSDASSFTSDLSKWQTGNVKDMSAMFSGAFSFNNDLSQWQTGNVKDMSEMFDGALALDEKPSWYTVGRYK